MLSTITIICRPTRDPELMQTKSGEVYTRLDVAQNKGYGDKEHPVYYCGWLKGDAAERFVRAGVKKGSQIYLTGEFDVKNYTKKDGSTGVSLNINVWDWGYVSQPKSNSDATAQLNQSQQVGNSPTMQQPQFATTPAMQNPAQPQFATPDNAQIPPQYLEMGTDDDLPF